MKKIIILSSSFPYLRGEEFLEEEVRIWAQYSEKVKVIFCPLNTAESHRPVPECIQIENLFKKSRIDTFLYVLKAIFHTLFIKEIKYWFFRKKRTRDMLADLHNALFLASRLSKILDGDEILYSYWFVKTAYAAVLLKKKFPNLKVITRAHRVDIYEHLRKGQYMPLKRSLINQYDEIHCVSNDGAAYLLNQFNASPDIINVSHLGVGDPLMLNSSADCIYIVSCSILKQVKRIDRIIDSLHHLSKSISKRIVWNHIGDGELLNNMKSYAVEKLSDCDNVEFNFLGSMSNQDVLTFYRENPISCFINTSESEGVPVSLMEAISYGIPIIAPDVGGISEIANEETGVLVSSQCDIQELSASIKLLSRWNSDKRKNVQDFWRKSFNSKKNYVEFITHLISF